MLLFIYLQITLVLFLGRVGDLGIYTKIEAVYPWIKANLEP